MVLLGSKIKELRTKYRFTQSELAELVGVTKSSIASYENDSRQPSYSVLIKLARTFNVSTDFLLLGKTDNTLRIDNLKDDQIRIIELLISSFQQSNSAENDSNQKQNPILYHYTTVIQASFTIHIHTSIAIYIHAKHLPISRFHLFIFCKANRWFVYYCHHSDILYTSPL